jgi:hypothetical protein
MITPCHLDFFVRYVLKFFLTTLLKHICLMLFKASIVIMNSYLLCCSLLIQVHFKTRFFFCLIMQVVHMYTVTWFAGQGIFE